jgi:hypothetical protein
MLKRRLIGYLSFFLLISVVVVLSLRRPQWNSSSGSKKTEQQNKSIENDYNKKADSHAKAEESKLLPDDAQSISEVRAALQQEELNRIHSCSEREDDSYIYYEFVISLPTMDQQKRINKIIKSTKGRTKDWFSDNVISWQQELHDEFTLPGQFKWFAVSVKWPKLSTDGQYTIVGIEQDKFGYDENGNPASSDGKVNIVRMGVMFDTQKDWRFSHILKTTYQ